MEKLKNLIKIGIRGNRMTQIMITLKKIKEYNPCEDGWEKVKAAKENLGMDTEFPVSDILETNDLSDTLWVLQCLPEHSNLWRKYAVWRALQVEHLMTDQRSKDALDIAWKHSEGEATDEELSAAWDAARVAARVAASHAARDAARDAAWDVR